MRVGVGNQGKVNRMDRDQRVANLYFRRLVADRDARTQAIADGAGGAQTGLDRIQVADFVRIADPLRRQQQQQQGKAQVTARIEGIKLHCAQWYSKDACPVQPCSGQAVRREANTPSR